MERKVPKIRETKADMVLEEIRRKAPFYVPEWTPGAEGDFGTALSRIFAGMAETIASNLNDAPKKHLLSFLDMLNFSLLPALPARTVLCFVPGPGAPENVVIPARTRATAEGPGGGTLFFETEKTIASTSSRLEFVCSTDREKGAILEHSSTVEGAKTSTLFSGRNLQKHAFYIGDEELFGIGKGEISLSLGASGPIPARVLSEKNLFAWEYAASESGKEEDEEDEEKREIDEWLPFSPGRFSEGKLIISKGEEAIGKGEVNGIKSRWIRCRLKEAEILELEQFLLSSVKVKVSAEGIEPELLFYNDIPLEDEGKGIQPLGSKPALYDTFYIACSEVFSRQGCEVRLDFELLPGKTGAGLPSEKPVLSWEYWDGESWRNLKKFMDFSVDLGEGRKEKGGEGEEFLEVEPENFLAKEITEKEAEKEPNEVTRFFNGKEKNRKEKDENHPFVQASAKIREMPPMIPGNVNGTENYWIRVRLIEGNFGKEYVISKKNRIEPGKFHPPEIRNLKLSYTDREGRKPGYLLSENNRVFENKGKELKLIGSFKPFKGIFEPLPAVYFGFTSKLVKGPLTLFARLEENFVDEGPPVKFRWQYLSAEENGRSGESEGEWKELEALDETGGLAKSGILEFFVPGEMKALQLFGSKKPLYWIRLLFIKGKRTPRISGLYPNCVWAVQARTVEDEILGSGSGEAGQVFMLMNRTVVDASVKVNEAAWLSEGEKHSLLKEKAREVEVIKDESGRFSEFWVRWEEVKDFSGSDGKSRHYLLDRTSGEIRFGDGTRGMIPPLGANNIKASYRTGGGKAGNREAYSITKLYSALKYVDAVYNPVASDGGSETESLDELLERSPAALRHRGRGVSADDIMQLAREASGKVAKVRVLSGSDEEGNSIPGLVTVVIVPDLPNPMPAPTGELAQMVESFLKARAPNTGKLKVAGPVYCSVDVEAELFTADPGTVHEVENRVKARIEEFLHPLRGGKEGNGWEFGQLPSTSDFYSLLGDCKGVSYVKGIEIKFRTENGTPGKLTGNSCISKNSRISNNTGISENSGTCGLSGLHALPESALPCSGKHEINVLWKAERRE